MEKFDNEYNLELKCGMAYCRPKISEPLAEASVSFEKNLVEQSLLRISTSREIVDPNDDSELWDKIAWYLKKNVLESGEERYSCKICDKMFKGDLFVEKHIQVKHDVLVDKEKNRYFWEKMINNYYADPNKQTYKPVAPES